MSITVSGHGSLVHEGAWENRPAFFIGFRPCKSSADSIGRRSSSVMRVAPYNSFDVAEAEGFLDGTDDLWMLQASIGIENEAVVRSFIDNPATGPFVVFC